MFIYKLFLYTIKLAEQSESTIAENDNHDKMIRFFSVVTITLTIELFLTNRNMCYQFFFLLIFNEISLIIEIV